MRQEKNMLIYFSGKLVPAACVLFIMIAGVRFLGKSEYGRYNLLFNCINIAITFFIGWIQQSMLRFNSGEHKELNLQLKQFTIYSLASALLASLCIFFLDWFYFDEPLLNCFLVSVFTFCFSLFMLYLSYLQSQFRPGRYAINESSFYVITTVAIFCIIYFSFPGKMIWFYCAWLAAGISWLAVTVLRSGKVMFEALRSEFDAPFFKKTFQYGFIITSWLMISNLYNVVDRFIIRHFYDYEQVGVYSAVYDFIYRLTSFAALPVLLTLHPLIMKTWNEGRDQAALSLVRKALFLLWRN